MADQKNNAETNNKAMGAAAGVEARGTRQQQGTGLERGRDMGEGDMPDRPTGQPGRGAQGSKHADAPPRERGDDPNH